LAFQIRELERQTKGDLKLDAIVTVIDAENFVGYEDTSQTARMQASYTDIILIVRPRHSSLPFAVLTGRQKEQMGARVRTPTRYCAGPLEHVERAHSKNTV
jgi:hypothetical protein